MGASDCEALGSGLLAQPVNALTSLAFVAAAAWLVARRRGGPETAMAAALALLGVGSFLFHGPQPSWGRALHDGSVVVAAAVAVVVAAALVRRRGSRAGATAVFPGVAVLAVGSGLRFLGLTGGAWCDPGSWLQPHGGWHLLAAIGLTMVARAAARAQPFRT